ncbi:MAG: nucleotidyl transferase AbiEii/AbiGii toxin family protein [Acidobacteria bacterium]|nr:nucleotidyl transferase AbiEii/AbiGii toxin family protein [Acidobacteriota bacterium]
MTLEEAVRTAAERARRMQLDPQVTISEVYEAELLRRLQQTLRGTVVWKGGTVLRLEGSERFSRDLDATRRRPSLSTLKLENVFTEAGRGLPYLSNTEVSKHPGAVTAAYRFAIPGLRQPVRVLVEISLREKVLLPATPISTARIAHPCGVEPVIVARLDPAELLAEKVRALVVRGASRDLYDVYWLLQRGADLDLPLFLRKMDYYRKLGRPVNPFAALERAIAELDHYDPARAKTELANLLPTAQRDLDFTVIVEDVRRALRLWLSRMRPTSARRPGRRAASRRPA